MGKISKKRVNTVLKEIGYTREEMQCFWDNLDFSMADNRLYKRLNLNWDMIDEEFLRALPTKYDTDLDKKNRALLKEYEELDRKCILELERKRYNDNFYDIMLDRLNKGIELTEVELKRLVEYREVDRREGDRNRWSMEIFSIIELGSELFCIEWSEGLTELQENSYYNQPYRVERKEKEITSIVVTYEKIDG